MLSRRYELKFPITAARRDRFLADARHGLDRDPHDSGAGYRVSSLYYDTGDLLAYWQKLDGEEIRRKHRLRYYTVDGLAVRNVFMEIKHRTNNTLYKERVRVADDAATAILGNPTDLHALTTAVANGPDAASSTVDAVIRATHAPGFGPMVVITYIREAWMARHDPRVRVTFDSAAQAFAPNQAFDVADSHGRPIIAPGHVVMEIKFDRAIPRWLRDAVTSHGIRQERFSKYAAGLKALDLVPAA